MSSKLYRLICVFIVIMVIGTGLYKSLLGSNSESWEKVGFESLKASMQKGLAIIHWQWQYEGRPSSILYETTQAQRIDRIEINADGWPNLARSREACRDFLNIFADSVVVEVSGLELDVDITKQLGISVEFLAQQELNDSGEAVDICRYSRKNQELEYHLGTGKLF
ncbi:hypothetical protein [Brumicola nitratireducens]|uniref:Uncharacterized protein n=1 Tax=Glaciecola nitratireducens (strain JCM 12485 / KCTC 12276 / FR1064) TaxID=1085623 RepID=G4QFF0_GLANF|nr:hypothetical protein [Glaciecola nitratireducens]AEP28494.1 hypothetical protein GNIT_0340 [Glaciecola nitratireducens FR1064]